MSFQWLTQRDGLVGHTVAYIASDDGSLDMFLDARFAGGSYIGSVRWWNRKEFAYEDISSPRFPTMDDAKHWCERHAVLYKMTDGFTNELFFRDVDA